MVAWGSLQIFNDPSPLFRGIPSHLKHVCCQETPRSSTSPWPNPVFHDHRENAFANIGAGRKMRLDGAHTCLAICTFNVSKCWQIPFRDCTDPHLCCLMATEQWEQWIKSRIYNSIQTTKLKRWHTVTMPMWRRKGMMLLLLMMVMTTMTMQWCNDAMMQWQHGLPEAHVQAQRPQSHQTARLHIVGFLHVLQPSVVAEELHCNFPEASPGVEQ